MIARVFLVASHTQPAAETSADRARRTFVYVTAGFAALGGLLFGYDTGVISGAELFLRDQFSLSTRALELIVSGVLVGAAIGALAGGRLADLFGRRRLLIATAVAFSRVGRRSFALRVTFAFDPCCRPNRCWSWNRPLFGNRASLYF